MGKSVLKKLNSQDHIKKKIGNTKMILFYFKLIGLAPFSSVNSECVQPMDKKATHQLSTTIKFVHSRFSVIYNRLLIAANLCMSMFCIRRLVEYEYQLKTSLTLITDVIQAVSSMTLMSALWLLTSIRSNHMVRLLNRLVKVDATISRLPNEQQTSIIRLHVIGIFIVLMIIWTVIIIADTFAYDATIIDLFNDVVPTFVIGHFVLQYALMVKFLEVQYRNLNCAIIDMSRSSIIRTFRSFTVHGEIALMNSDYFPKITDFRRAHNTLYEIGSNVAEFYSLPILFILALSCFQIVYNAYFGLVPLTIEMGMDPTFFVTCSVAWVLVLIVPITILAKGVDSITKEMRRTADAIYKMLDGSNLSREDRTELEQFSIELLHRKIYFTAYGLFSLDCSLVHSIISSTITYLVILLQFQISAE